MSDLPIASPGTPNRRAVSDPSSPVISLSREFSGIMLQPTTRCNLDCAYCYLPDRQSSKQMSVAVAERIANHIQNFSKEPVQVIWHGGEPLVNGLNHLQRLVEPFKHLLEAGRVTHCIQSNGTALSHEICDFFLANRFTVSISVDGPRDMNRLRRNWAGREAFAAIMRGIDLLNERNVRFGIIAVVTEQSLGRAAELYDFACGLGCSTLGIAFEETKGVNRSGVTSGGSVAMFWRKLIAAWRANPVITVREIDRFTHWAAAVCSDRWDHWSVEGFPAIAWNGDVTLLSPEFVNMTPGRTYRTFVVGNVLNDELSEILEHAVNVDYVADFMTGIAECRSTCSYYSYCGGGCASNKYFELGSTRGTETEFCRNRVQLFSEAMLEMAPTPA